MKAQGENKFVLLRGRKKASPMFGAWGVGRRERGDERGEAGRGEITQGLVGSGKKLDFILSIMGGHWRV